MESEQIYQMHLKSEQLGIEAVREITEEFRHPQDIQDSVLRQILCDNADTEYGKKYGFGEIKSFEDFQKKVPVIVYENISDDILRMENGEKNILTAYAYDHFNQTSGTVGAPKAIPFTDRQKDVFVKYDNLWGNGIYAKYLDPSYLKGRVFVTSEGTCKKLDSGLTLGCASAKMAEFVRGGRDAYDKMIALMFTSPSEASNPDPGTNTKYIHTRFALMDRDITGIVSGFYSIIVYMMTYIKDNYKMLIDDIEKGTIDESVRISDAARESLMKKIEPMPERAAELREIFKNGADIRFMPLVWPKLQYLMGVGGDGFSIYDTTLKEKFHGGKLLNFYHGITASEGLFSLHFEPDNEESVLAPGAAFMEFLPEEAGDDFSKAVTMDKVEVGKIYELIITGFCGLYRYRMGDTVLITGMYENTPKVKFMYRANKTISVIAEKTTETALKQAVLRTADEYGLRVEEYCVYGFKEEVPGTYRFFIETTDENRFSIDRAKFSESLLKNLSEANPRFTVQYGQGNIAVPTVEFLQPESHILWKDLMVYKGASASQLKPVRVMDTHQYKFFSGLVERHIG